MRTQQQNAASFMRPDATAEAIGVEKGQLVADFGAGSGRHTFHFASLLGSGGRVYAIDVQRDLLRRIQNEAQRLGFKNVEVIHGNIERPGGSRLAENIVDLVVLSNVLFQLEAKAAALQEAWRILKPSGTLAIIDWSDSFGGMGPRSSAIVNEAAALALAEANGFRLARKFGAGAHHYGLLLAPIPQVRA